MHTVISIVYRFTRVFLVNMSIRNWDEYKESQKTPQHGFLGDTVDKTQLSLCMYGLERKTHLL